MPLRAPPSAGTEVRANLGLAMPLIGAQIAAVGMGAIDTVYAGRLGAQPLAAVAVGVNLYNLFLFFGMGLLMACSPIVAQLHGAGRSAAEINAFMRRARGFALLVGLLWMLAIQLLAPLALAALELPAETTALSLRFIRVLAFAGIGTALWFALRFSAEGLGQVRPIIVAGLSGLVVNAGAGWLLIFGHAGLPALGVEGLGLATTLATAVMALVLWLHYRRVPALRAISAAVVDASTPPPHAARQVLRLGLPIAAILVAEGGLFVMTALLMSRFGESAVAAYQIAINIASLFFMIPFGVGMATTVRVGHAAGAGDAQAVRQRGHIGIAIGGLNAASNAAVMLLFGGVLVGWYTSDPLIAGQAQGFLWLAAAFQLFDGVQGTASGALRGVKDTRLPMLVTLLSYWGIGFPIALFLGFCTPLGPAGLWWGLTAGLAAAAVGLALRFWLKTRIVPASKSSIDTAIDSEKPA